MFRSPLIQPYIFIGIAYLAEVSLEFGTAYYHRESVVVGVETQRLLLAQRLVEEEVHMVLGVVYQSKGRYRAGAKSQPAHHALCRGKRELALVEYLFEVVDSHRALRVEDHEVVAITLVVAEEEVFAVLRAILTPILACYVNGGSLGVFVPRVLDIVAVEPLKYFVASFHICKDSVFFDEKMLYNKINFLTLCELFNLATTKQRYYERKYHQREVC